MATERELNLIRIKQQKEIEERLGKVEEKLDKILKLLATKSVVKKAVK